MKKIEAEKRMTRWSYSRLKAWEDCAMRAYDAHELGNRGAGNQYSNRGSEMHDHAERWLKGEKGILLPTFFKDEPFKSEAMKLRRCGAISEQAWLVEAPPKPLTKRPWIPLKVVLDHHVVKGKVAYVGDFKSGKVYDDHPNQLELYALVAMEQHPQVEEVRGELWYLDHAKLVRGSFTRADKKKVPLRWTRAESASRWRAWGKRLEPMVQDRVFVPTANRYCRYCRLSKSNRGPCRY